MSNELRTLAIIAALVAPSIALAQTCPTGSVAQGGICVSAPVSGPHLWFRVSHPNHVEASLQEFDRCVRDGPMVGVKLWVARHCSAPELDPIVEHALQAARKRP